MFPERDSAPSPPLMTAWVCIVTELRPVCPVRRPGTGWQSPAEGWCWLIATGVCCERCPGATPERIGDFARRRMLKAAVFQPSPAGGPRDAGGAQRDAGGAAGTGGTAGGGRVRAGAGPAAGGAGGARGAADLAEQDGRQTPPAHLYRSVTGQVLDVSPHFVTIGFPGGERQQRFALTADATAWRGGPLEPAAVWPGDEAVIRLVPSRPGVADRIWANIGRVSGTILRADAESVVVSEGITKRERTVVIPRRAASRIQVRFPRLLPGYLIDVIGTRRGDVVEALAPATSQPPYRSDQARPQGRPGGLIPEAITGSAVWHDALDEPYGMLGVCYPAVDPAAGCAEDQAAGTGPGQAPAARALPYLAVGSALLVRNDCTGLAWTLPVTGCAPTARLFNDRCTACHPGDRCGACQASVRGRVADLTLASFVALGGELERGCFNATITIGR